MFALPRPLPTIYLVRKLISSFSPIVNERSQVLILGSMPSIASLQQQEYYGHPQNRFWKLLSLLYDIDLSTYDNKVAGLLENHLALWDVIAACEREGSLDSNIINEIDNDIPGLLATYPSIQRILCNGSKAGSIYKKQFSKRIALPYQILPSTSPANASYSLVRLQEIWEKALIQ